MYDSMTLLAQGAVTSLLLYALMGVGALAILIVASFTVTNKFYVKVGPDEAVVSHGLRWAESGHGQRNDGRASVSSRGEDGPDAQELRDCADRRRGTDMQR